MWHQLKASDSYSMEDGTPSTKDQISNDLDQENHNTEDSKAADAEVGTNERERETFRFEEVTTQAKGTGQSPAPLKEKVRALNVAFCKQTTAHGWGRVGRAHNKYVGMLWIAITIVALGLNISHVFLLIKYYLRYKYEMKTQFVSVDTEFPAITLCNILPWSMTSTTQFLQNDNSSTYHWHQLTMNLSKFDQFAALLNRTDEFNWAKDRMKQPQGYFENVGLEIIPLGHSRKDFILSCTFDLRECNDTNFVYYPTPNFFNCYTFQTMEAWGRTTGPNAGLSMVLYLEAYDKNTHLEGAYFKNSNIGNAAGVRVTIHAPRTRPSPIDQGFDIPPGYSANIGLNVHQYVHLGEPYSKCVEDVANTRSRSEQYYAYSAHDCMRNCQQQYIMQHCGCISSTLPFPNTNDTNMTYCGTWNVTKIGDLDAYLNRMRCEATNMLLFMETMTESCDCYLPCVHTEHTTDMSYSSWPIQYSQANFFKSAVLDHPDSTELKAYQHLASYNSSELTEYNLIRTNFVRINIFRKSILVEQHLEKPAYDIAQLASDMGGTFGLWIGMSVISWCEVSELMILVLITVCKSLGRINKGDRQGL